MLSTKDNSINYKDMADIINNGDVEMLESYIANDFDVNSILQDSYNKKSTALHLACRYSYTLHKGRQANEKLIAALINAGANVNVKERDGMTPLHWACLNLHRSVIRFLVDNGADVNAKNNSGDTPIDILNNRINGMLKLSKSLEKHRLCFFHKNEDYIFLE